MAGVALSFTTTLVSFGGCTTCGVDFAAPQELLRVRREHGGHIYCPNGHANHYGKTRVQQLTEELEAEKKRAEARIEFHKSQRESAERQAAAAKGQVTKLKNRIGNGVCPCCNRTFQNLMAHMKTKRPDFKDEGALPALVEKKK